MSAQTDQNLQLAVAIFLTIAFILGVTAFASKNSIPVRVALVVALCAGLWLWWPALAPWWSQRPPPENVGQFGDMFGPLSAFFSSLAVIGVAVTVWFERDSNARQRVENERQQSLIQQQAFESTFFNLAAQFRQLRPVGLLVGDFPTSETDQIGDTRFREAAKRVASWLVEGSYTGYPVDERSDAILTSVYGPVYEANIDALGPYFRSMYHWFKFVDESQLPEKKKNSYASMARAQLSNSDLIFLAVNCMTALGEGMTKYLVRYALLKHLADPDWTTMIRQASEEVLPAAAFRSTL